jgi:hypothetical protein
MSDKNGNMDDLIRDGFNSSEESFDFGSWTDIEKKLDARSDIDAQIKSAFLAEAPHTPGDAWPEIKEELDVDTVWTRIDRQLTRRKRRAFIWWNAAAVSLLLLLAGYVFQNKFVGEAEETSRNYLERDEVETDPKASTNFGENGIVNYEEVSITSEDLHEENIDIVSELSTTSVNVVGESNNTSEITSVRVISEEFNSVDVIAIETSQMNRDQLALSFKFIRSFNSTTGDIPISFKICRKSRSNPWNRRSLCLPEDGWWVPLRWWTITYLSDAVNKKCFLIQLIGAE